MKRKISIITLLFALVFNFPSFAAPLNRKDSAPIDAIEVSVQTPIVYTVKAGDTLSIIARQYNVTVTAILNANPSIKNLNMIYVGQKITIPAANFYSMENEVVRLVNVERSKRGLAQLKINSTLMYVARLKSTDMATKNYFSHISPTYGSPFTMMQKFGIKFSAAGENIAYGQRTPQEVMTAWMNSPGHRSNILSPAYTEIGVGVAKDKNGRLYWTQEFIKPIR